MEGTARVGINLRNKHGHVMIASVLSDSPASKVLAKGDVVLEVNGVAVGHDAQTAQLAIRTASVQSTVTGHLLPVRLTVGTLELPSPKGIEADFGLDLSDPTHGDSRRVVPPLEIPREVVQVL